MAEMKPCPFCGELLTPRIVCRIGRNGWRDRWCVPCEYGDGGCGAESGWYYSQDEAIEAWNRRAASGRPYGGGE